MAPESVEEEDECVSGAHLIAEALKMQVSVTLERSSNRKYCFDLATEGGEDQFVSKLLGTDGVGYQCLYLQVILRDAI